MRPGKFAVGAFDGVALFHVLRVLGGLHFVAAALKMRMVFPDQKRAVMDAGSDALVSQGTGIAGGAAPFEAVVGNTGSGNVQAAADGAGMTGGADRASLVEIDIEHLGCEEDAVRQERSPRPAPCSRPTRCA